MQKWKKGDKFSSSCTSLGTNDGGMDQDGGGETAVELRRGGVVLLKLGRN
jgi:hypothetical protein